MALKSNNSTAYLPFVECFEAKHDANPRFALGCALKAGYNAQQMQACMSGAQGKQIQDGNARKTLAFGPSRKGTPWVVINGKYEEAASDNLTRAICEAYQGTKP